MCHPLWPACSALPVKEGVLGAAGMATKNRFEEMPVDLRKNNMFSWVCNFEKSANCGIDSNSIRLNDLTALVLATKARRSLDSMDDQARYYMILASFKHHQI